MTANTKRQAISGDGSKIFLLFLSRTGRFQFLPMDACFKQARSWATKKKTIAVVPGCTRSRRFFVPPDSDAVVAVYSERWHPVFASIKREQK